MNTTTCPKTIDSVIFVLQPNTTMLMKLSAIFMLAHKFLIGKRSYNLSSGCKSVLYFCIVCNNLFLPQENFCSVISEINVIKLAQVKLNDSRQHMNIMKVYNVFILHNRGNKYYINAKLYGENVNVSVDSCSILDHSLLSSLKLVGIANNLEPVQYCVLLKIKIGRMCYDKCFEQEFSPKYVVSTNFLSKYNFDQNFRALTFNNTSNVALKNCGTQAAEMRDMAIKHALRAEHCTLLKAIIDTTRLNTNMIIEPPSNITTMYPYLEISSTMIIEPTPILSINAYLYEDDLVIVQHDLDSTMHTLSIFFNRMRENKIKLSANKSAYNKLEFQYLGHMISKEEYKINPSKVKDVQNFKSYEILLCVCFSILCSIISMLNSLKNR